MPPPSAHAVTETFQHYQVLRKPDGSLWELGRGAMGVTYKAFDTNLRSQVCLKVINAMHLDSESARGRFLREARSAAGLRHRNVASVYHLGNDDQSFFYAMEFVDGETVEGLVKRRGALPPAEALDIVLQVARALGAAHRQGLVHRDIKPANLMVVREDEEDETLVKVIDFGLARSTTNAEGSAHITMGGFVGTPQYASPEQLQEQDLDTRSDIYSLGITLWYLVAGRPPFTGPLGNVFLQHLTKDPPWDQLGPLADGPLRTLLARMLAKEPAQRPQTPLELRRETEVCLRALATTTPVVRSVPAADDHDEGTSHPTLGDTAAATAAEPLPTAAPDGSAAPSPGLETLATDVPESTATPAALAPAPLEVGAILAGRYELERFAGEGDSGRVFRARDLSREGRHVAVKILHPGLLAELETAQALQAELLKLRAAPHPGLIAFEELERDGAAAFLVGEWVDGFTLVDLLRARGQLPARETLRLLEPAAVVADHASAHGLERLQLGPHQILATLRGATGSNAASGTEGSGTRSLLSLSIERWPEFGLKLDPLGITAEAGEFVTWAGDRTMLPGSGPTGSRTASRDTQTSIRGLFDGSYLPALAALAYELLSGTPPPTGSADFAAHRLTSLPALGEDGNTLLRRALSSGEPAFKSGREFYVALARTCGVQPLPDSGPASPDTPTLAAAVAEPAPVLPPAALPIPESEADDAGAQTLLLDDGAAPAATFVPEEPAAATVASPASDRHLPAGEVEPEEAAAGQETLAVPTHFATLVEGAAAAPAPASVSPAPPVEEPSVSPVVEPEVAAPEPMQAPELAPDELSAASPVPTHVEDVETARAPRESVSALPLAPAVAPSPDELLTVAQPALVPVPPLPFPQKDPAPVATSAFSLESALPLQTPAVLPPRSTPTATLPPAPRKSSALPVPVLAAVGGGVALLGAAVLVWSFTGHRQPSPAPSPSRAVVQPSVVPAAPPQPTPIPVVRATPAPPRLENVPPPPPAAPSPLIAEPVVVKVEEKRPETTPAETPAVASRAEASEVPAAPPSEPSPSSTLETGRAAVNPPESEPAAESRTARKPAHEPPPQLAPAANKNYAAASAAEDARKHKEEARKEEARARRQREADAAPPPRKSEPAEAPRPKATPKAAEKPKPQPTPEAPQQRAPAVPFMR